MHAQRPLLASDIVVVFADLQEGIVNVGATNEQQRLRAAAGALADLAGTFGLPVLVSCVPTTGGTVAPLLAEVGARLPQANPLVRTTASPFDDPPFCVALDATARTTLVIAGVASEVAVRLTALAAVGRGLHAIVAVDACSGLNARTEAAAFTQMAVAGVELSAVATIAAQLAGDFRTEGGRAAMRALQATIQLHAHEHEHEHEHEADNTDDRD
jgi:nicotinamidase-related amidase